MARNLFLSIAWFLLLINLGVPLQGGYNRHPFFLDMNVLRTTWYIRVSAFTFNFSSRTLTISKVRTPVSNKSTSCPGFEIQEERYPMGSFRRYSMFFGWFEKKTGSRPRGDLDFTTCQSMNLDYGENRRSFVGKCCDRERVSDEVTWDDLHQPTTSTVSPF